MRAPFRSPIVRVGAPLVLAVAFVVAGFVSERPPGARGAADISPAPPGLAVDGLRTALYVDSGDQFAAPDLVFRRILQAGATIVRFTVYWADVAPATRPPGFHPADPADPNYSWGPIDEEVKAAVAHGLEPMITVMAAPAWAQTRPAAAFPNSHLPSPAAFGQFARAIATRYSGHFQGLPAVHYWEAWNEPNLSLYLVPQLWRGKPTGADRYRLLLNAFADAIHGVSAQNLVVAGAMAPFRDTTPAVVRQNADWGPLAFMRALLCLSPDLQPTCDDPVKFDVWSQHPYTSGGPQHHAVLPNDVSLGDLGEVTKTLRAAERAGHIVSRRRIQFWVTEFSWDSDPPDPRGVPVHLETRWVAEALYRMWSAGVDVVTWLALRDEPLATSPYQSGLYYRGASIEKDRPKPILEAFRFPFVAYAQHGTILVWGRIPPGTRGAVRIALQEAGKSTQLGTVASAPSGIFSHRFRTAARRGDVRATLISTGESAVPFSLTVPPDHFYNPFGLVSPLEPSSNVNPQKRRK